MVVLPPPLPRHNHEVSSRVGFVLISFIHDDHSSINCKCKYRDQYRQSATSSTLSWSFALAFGLSITLSVCRLLQGSSILSHGFPGVEHVTRRGGGGSGSLPKRQILVAGVCRCVVFFFLLLSY